MRKFTIFLMLMLFISISNGFSQTQFERNNAADLADAPKVEQRW